MQKAWFDLTVKFAAPSALTALCRRLESNNVQMQIFGESEMLWKSESYCFVGLKATPFFYSYVYALF